MRVELPVALKPGQKYVLKVAWNYKITDRLYYGGRGVMNILLKRRIIYLPLTQWYPRLCVYSDFQGWQNHQFAGKEFALTFESFKVKLTVPADYVVGATGECRNYSSNLNAVQLARWKKGPNF